MTEVENLSTQNDDWESLDLQKTLAQQLASLRLAGLSHLPAGTGEYSFDFSNSETSESIQSTTQAPETPTVPAALNADVGGNSTSTAPANLVRESPAQGLAAKMQVETPAVTRAAPPVARPLGITRENDNQPYGSSLLLDDRQSALKVLQQEIAGCTLCSELSSTRTQTVFGVGNPTPRIVLLGEGPGFHEDRTGEPFVGESGEQLDKIITACKLKREEVFILNAVKCRPPANRTPSQVELANCWGYAERQLEILQPEFIVCLGSVAARTLLNTTESLGRLRKRFHAYRSSRVLVTYHPAYLLRTPSAKRHVWEDMKMLMKELGIDWTK